MQLISNRAVVSDSRICRRHLFKHPRMHYSDFNLEADDTLLVLHKRSTQQQY